MDKINRRDFLKLGLGGSAGLVIGMYLPGCGKQESETQAGPGQAGSSAVVGAGFEPNAFLRINPDNTVTVISKHLEMGQGTYTGLATLVAEELDADWNQVKVEGAPANKKYNNLFWGAQGTGGSTAIANSWEQMRKAGAAARSMIVEAAAASWGVPAGEVMVDKGVVSHTSGKSATLGELAELASQQEVPPDELLELKEPSQFKLIGRPVSRKDSDGKVNGTAQFTQDMQLPGMLTAVVAHPALFGATVKSYDDSQSKQVKGVEAVIRIPSGVAVVAKDFWSARQGRDALRIEWDESDAFKLGTDEILQQYAALADGDGIDAVNNGDADGVLNAADEVSSAEYRYPFLAHAALEPMNCVIHVQGDKAEVWNGVQVQTMDQGAVAKVLGIAPENVTLNMLYAGGSFGRRANPASDYILEAAHIAKGLNQPVPVKLVWTREDDTRAGWYRPINLHRIKATLDDEGMPRAWHHRIVGQSIMTGTAFAGMIQNDIDPTSVEGASNLPYAVPNIRVDLHSPTLGVPIQWWRSVGSTHTAYSVETFIDELATKAGKDPVDYRLALLKDHPRHANTLKLAADKAGWQGAAVNSTEGKTTARGVALHESFNSVVAMIADVSVTGDRQVSVDKVTIAVDCGIAVNPDIVKAQMEGGMGFGLGTVFTGGEITLDKGRVVQSNFHDYQVLRLPQMPDVEVHIVPSGNPPTGVGEPATPVIAPAIANAVAAATGKRHYKLPFA